MQMNISLKNDVMAKPNDDIAISRQSSALTASNVSWSLNGTDVSLDTLHRTVDRKPFEQRAYSFIDSSSESDFDYNEEINMEDLEFNDSVFHWKAPPTPQLHNRWELYLNFCGGERLQTSTTHWLILNYHSRINRLRLCTLSLEYIAFFRNFCWAYRGYERSSLYFY